MLRIASLLLVALGILLGAFSAVGAAPRALVLTVKGAINPLSASYIARGIDEANSTTDRTKLVVIRLDTPGGLDTSMREIVQKEISSKVPVVVFVAPDGARAASAGLFIAMGAHVAAMAPNTAIGAAHPVGGGGEEIKGHMAKKVEHDAAAYIRGLAKEHGRNAEWAEKAVRESVSLAASEAYKKKVVDVIAPDVPALLERIDGRKVHMRAGVLTLRTKHLALADFDMTAMERLMYTVTDPSIAFILLNLGMLGLFFELSNPGAVLPGIIGGICLLLAFYGLGMLPVNYAGVALILFAFLLFVAELFAPSHGALTIGGVVSLVLGGFILMSGGGPDMEVSRPLILTVALSTGGLFAACLALALKAQGRRVTTGREDLIGRTAKVKIPLQPEGQVFLEGERWHAVAEEGPVAAGESVVVKRVEGLTLYVGRIPSESGT
ncbi:MAG: nodulation protein NfeD [Candidatus Sericytochromatia bacterium]|nr:nodulation protein NfeD [Candidatus Tanganyikabacteria bacterium]